MVTTAVKSTRRAASSACGAPHCPSIAGDGSIPSVSTTERTGELLDYAALFAAPPEPAVTDASPCTCENLRAWGLEDLTDSELLYSGRYQFRRVRQSRTIAQALAEYRSLVGAEPTMFWASGAFWCYLGPSR